MFSLFRRLSAKIRPAFSFQWRRPRKTANKEATAFAASRYQSSYVPNRKIAALRARQDKFKQTTMALRVKRESLQAACDPLECPVQRSASGSSCSIPMDRLGGLSPSHQKMVTRAASMGVWGGDEELAALAKVLKVEIRVWKRVQGPAGSLKQVVNHNAEALRAVDIVYNGYHYEALENFKLIDRTSATATSVPTPGDGNCLFHAVAEAAQLPYLDKINAAYRQGRLEDLLDDPLTRALFEMTAASTDSKHYQNLRQAWVLQLRYDTAKELSKEDYAAFCAE
jgi:hypothetical protein